MTGSGGINEAFSSVSISSIFIPYFPICGPVYSSVNVKFI